MKGFFFSYVVGYFSSCDNRFLGMRFLSALIASDGSDSVSLYAEELQDEFLIVSARAPMPMMMGGYAWYTIHWDANDGKFSDIPEAKASLEKINQSI